MAQAAKKLNRRPPKKELTREERIERDLSEAESLFVPDQRYTPEFRSRVAQVMIDHNISANQLAERIGVSQPSLSRWKKDREIELGIRKPEDVEPPPALPRIDLKNQVVLVLIPKEQFAAGEIDLDQIARALGQA